LPQAVSGIKTCLERKIRHEAFHYPIDRLPTLRLARRMWGRGGKIHLLVLRNQSTRRRT
jgi:hypothetical protein